MYCINNMIKVVDVNGTFAQSNLKEIALDVTGKADTWNHRILMKAITSISRLVWFLNKQLRKSQSLPK